MTRGLFFGQTQGRRHQMVFFAKNQTAHIRKGGLSVLARKFGAGCFFLLAVPAVLLVRIISPFFLIRFGRLGSNRIGHLAGNTEMYLAARDLEPPVRPTLDVFYHTDEISNQQLKKMIERCLHVFPPARWLDKANALIPGGKRHLISELQTDKNRQGLIVRTPAHLSFTPEEELQGREFLAQAGVPEDCPFVCFFGRDSAYLETAFPSMNWDYHSYRDSNVEDYIPAVKELVQRGYFAFRMGAVVKEKLSYTHRQVIDYAVNGRTDFLDIYLLAKCRFSISCTAGISSVPWVFRRLTVFVNFVPLEYIPGSGLKGDLFLPKRYWLKEERRFLSFREILGSDIGRLSTSEEFERRGIAVVDNTAGEIHDVVREMEDRLAGRWQTTDEDEELQQRFWELYQRNAVAQESFLRIGTQFLRQNRALLD